MWNPELQNSGEYDMLVQLYFLLQAGKVLTDRASGIVMAKTSGKRWLEMKNNIRIVLF